MPRFSAIDIGSNAIRMIVGEVIDHKMEILKKYRAPVRLGHDVFMAGKISEKTFKEAQSTFKEFSALNKKYKVDKCRAVATSALREAKNRRDFVKRIGNSTEIKIEVINGIKEAELIFSAVNKEVDLADKQAVLIDIGGGSVEVTICQNEKIHCTESFPVGTVRLLENLTKRKLSEKHINVVVAEFIKPLVKYLNRESKGLDFDFAVGTGGNLEAMARLKVQLLKKTPNTFVTLSELAEITRILKNYSVRERISKLDLRPDRADVIIPAIMVVKTIMRQAGIQKILVPGVGLRDGLLWSVAGV